MKSMASLVACSLILVGSAVAKPDAGGPPPAFKVVTSVNKDKGLISFTEVVFKNVPVIKEVVKNVNGQVITEKVTVYETIAEERVLALNAADCTIMTPDRKQLPIDEVWKRVKAKSVVVVSGNSNTPAQAYLRALSAETLVIIPGAPKNEVVPPMKKE